MVATIKDLKELIEKTDSSDVPGISYLEWLNCYHAFLEKIEEDDSHYNYLGDTSPLMFVDVTGMDEESEKNYEKLVGYLRKFVGAYNYARGSFANGYTASAKEVWKQVLQGTAKVDGNPPEFRPLR